MFCTPEVSDTRVRAGDGGAEAVGSRGKVKKLWEAGGGRSCVEWGGRGRDYGE